MDITRWANLATGLAGALAAWAANSQALLIDGLFSLVGYVSAVYAMRISKRAHLGPDRDRPFGYAPEEALYATFRSLALIGLVVFGVALASMGISDYLWTGDVEEVRLVPVAIYSGGVAITCFWLAYIHYGAWVATGRRSDMLQLEIKASIYDGLITLLAGLALLSTPLLTKTSLAPLAPVMDSVVVLLICGGAMLEYLRMFRQGVTQLAGASASASDQHALECLVRPIVQARGGHLVDIAAVRFGRTLDTVMYYRPDHAVTAAEVDGLTNEIEAAVRETLGPAQVLIVVSGKSRSRE